MDIDRRQVASIEVEVEIRRADGTVEPRRTVARTDYRNGKPALTLFDRALVRFEVLRKRLAGARKP